MEGVVRAVDLFLMFAAGWLIAYFFYRRRQRAGERIYAKLSVDARNFLLNDPRERLGLADIIALFYEKIIAEHLDSLDQPFPYKRCPRCGSKKVRRFVVKADGTTDFQNVPDTPPIAGEEFNIFCPVCGYKDKIHPPG